MKDSTIIDFNSIYISQYIGVNAGHNKIDTAYFFKRFWPTGQVFLSYGQDHYPTNDEINNLRSGMIGYYKIEDSILVTEIFIPWQGGTYDVTYAKIKGDSLIFYERESGLFFGLTNEKIENSVWVRAINMNIKLWAKPDW